MNSLLSIVLMSAGIDAEAHDIGVTAVGISARELKQLLASLPECPEIDDLASFVVGLRAAKLDDFIDEDLLRSLWARRNEIFRLSVTNIIADIRI